MIIPCLPRPVTDFNYITLHFLECIHVHLDNTRPKVLMYLRSVLFVDYDVLMYFHIF